MLSNYFDISKLISITRGTILTIEDNKLKYIDGEIPLKLFKNYITPLTVPPENKFESEGNVGIINSLPNKSNVPNEKIWYTVQSKNAKLNKMKSLDIETKSNNKFKSTLTRNWSKRKSFSDRTSFQKKEYLIFIRNIYLYNEFEFNINLSTVRNDSFIENELVEFEENNYGRIQYLITINGVDLACIKRNPYIEANLDCVMKEIAISVDINSDNFQGIIIRIESLKKFNQPLKFITGTCFIDHDSIKFEENYESNKIKMDDIIKFVTQRKIQYAKVIGSSLINNVCCLKIFEIYPINGTINVIQEDIEMRIFDEKLDMVYYEEVIMKPSPILKVEEMENENFKINDPIKFSLMHSLNSFYGVIKWTGNINDIPVAIIDLDNINYEFERDFKLDYECSKCFENLEFEENKQFFVIPICFLMKTELKKNNVENSNTLNGEKNVTIANLICLKQDNIFLTKNDICEFSFGYLISINNQDISLDNSIFSNYRKLSESESDLLSPLKPEQRIRKMEEMERKKSNKTNFKKTKSLRKKFGEVFKKTENGARIVNSTRGLAPMTPDEILECFLLNKTKLENVKFDCSKTDYKKDDLLIINLSTLETYGRFYCTAKYKTDIYICIKSNNYIEDKLERIFMCIIFKNNTLLNDFEGIIIRKEFVRKFDYELRFLKDLPIVDDTTEKYSEINPKSKFKTNDLVKYIVKDIIYYARVVDPYLTNEICCLQINWMFPKNESPCLFKESEMIKIKNLEQEMKFFDGTIMAPNPVLRIDIKNLNFIIGDKVEFIFKYSMTTMKGVVEWIGILNGIPCTVVDLIILKEDNIKYGFERDYKIDYECSKYFENLEFEENKELFVIPICFLMKTELKKNNVVSSNGEKNVTTNRICSDTCLKSNIEEYIEV